MLMPYSSSISSISERCSSHHALNCCSSISIVSLIYRGRSELSTSIFRIKVSIREKGSRKRASLSLILSIKDSLISMPASFKNSIGSLPPRMI